MAFDQSSKGMQKWMQQFGIDSHQLNILQQIDGNSSDTFDKIKEVVEQVLRYKKYEQD